jgi:NAD(P)-dependent dehydrogenase (short-subunit alcohol dehydrogenase family)
MSGIQRKVIVVTGGTSGIGLASARALAAQGARVYVSGRRSEAFSASVAEASDTLDLRFVRADVADEAEVSALFARVIDECGRVDGLVASHGTLGAPGPLAEQRLSDFRAAVDVNLVGTFLAARAAVRAMTGGGSIVLVASTVGNGVYFPGVSAYAATKASIVALAKTLALEVAPAGIRVNALVPGGVDTPMFRSTMGATPESAAHIASLHALGRVARPDELASAVVFLTSDASSFVTGSALYVDGGMTTK